MGPLLGTRRQVGRHFVTVTQRSHKRLWDATRLVANLKFIKNVYCSVLIRTTSYRVEELQWSSKSWDTSPFRWQMVKLSSPPPPHPQCNVDFYPSNRATIFQQWLLTSNNIATGWYFVKDDYFTVRTAQSPPCNFCESHTKKMFSNQNKNYGTNLPFRPSLLTPYILAKTIITNVSAHRACLRNVTAGSKTYNLLHVRYYRSVTYQQIQNKNENKP